MVTHNNGLIHTIERFSLHDGPGVRTLVVMKGCPLKCRWCSSPYTQQRKPEIVHIKSRCQSCGSCIEICPNHAIVFTYYSTQVVTDRSKCIGCGECISVCANRARELSGRYYTVHELFQEVEKDAAFYRRSDGGITVGGGEPTIQAEFVGSFLALCQENGIHTAMETCSMTSWDRLERLLDHLDLVYMDLKHMDSNRHKEWTGASNDTILDNIRKTAKRNQVILRIPVVPGFNDNEKNISKSAMFAKELGSNVLRVELLPYHQFGIHRYEELDRVYGIEAIEPPSEAHMKQLQDIVRTFGIDVEIGG